MVDGDVVHRRQGYRHLLQYSVPTGRHLRAQEGGHAPFWVKLMGSATQVSTYVRYM